MHAAAISVLLVTIVGQVGGDYTGGGYSGGSYGNAQSQEYDPPMTVRAGATTRSTRATTRATTRPANPLNHNYQPSRVATSPRYADSPQNHQNGLPPVGDSNRLEDPQSALADKLLRQMIQPASGEQNVRALRLVDALERTSGSQQQFTAIKAYWDWWAAVSELYGVDEEHGILHDRKIAPRTAHDQASHAANIKASQARLEDTRLDVAAKVVDLMEATGMRNSTTALRPADVPFVSAYNTNFSKLFPNGTGPVTLKKINQTMPYALKVVRTRAEAYAASWQALSATQTALHSQQCPYDDFVNALALMRSQRRAFLDSVHDYNYAIAEYALSVAGPGMRRETVVSMLIRPAPTSYRGASLDYSGDVLPASATDSYSESYTQESYDTYRVPSVEHDARRLMTGTLLR